MATDVHTRHTTLHCGLAIAPRSASDKYGTLGCIIRTTGRSIPVIPAGLYLLTNYHVITYSVPNGPYQGDGIILQPECYAEFPTPDYNCARYVYGLQDPENDCAICSVSFGRKAENKFPTRNWKLNHRRVRGLATAKVGDVVYKFGATTGYTKGIVVAVNKYFQERVQDRGGEKVKTFQHTIQIRGLDGGAFCAPGDSGSLVVRKSDDKAVGLLFLEDSATGIPNTQLCKEGYAYDLSRQMRNFCNDNGTVTLV
jgi:hypothetical protein